MDQSFNQSPFKFLFFYFILSLGASRTKSVGVRFNPSTNLLINFLELLLVLVTGSLTNKVGRGEPEHGCSTRVLHHSCQLAAEIGQHRQTEPEEGVCTSSGPWGFLRISSSPLQGELQEM